MKFIKRIQRNKSYYYKSNKHKSRMFWRYLVNNPIKVPNLINSFTSVMNKVPRTSGVILRHKRYERH